VNLKSLNIKIYCLDSDAVEAKTLITDANLHKYNLIHHDQSIGHLAQSKKSSKKKRDKAGGSETLAGKTTEEKGQVSPKGKKVSRGIFEDEPSVLKEAQGSKPPETRSKFKHDPSGRDGRN